MLKRRRPLLHCLIVNYKEIETDVVVPQTVDSAVIVIRSGQHV